MLLESRSCVQARYWIQANRFQYLLGSSWRIDRQPRGLSSQTAERPLAIDQPGIKQENQTERGPARLIGTDFVKIIRVLKERMNRGQHEGHCREYRDQQRGEPQPPLVPRNFLRVEVGCLDAEIPGALERRGFWLACGTTKN